MAEQREHGIAWTEQTWNPVRGCSRVSEGCRNCYSENVAARFSGPGLPYEGLAKRVGGEARWTGNVVLVPEHLSDPLRWKRPRRVFVNSMSDLFHEGWLGWTKPGEFTGPGFGQLVDIASVMRQAARHTFQVLTKRAAVMADLWPRVLAKLNSGPLSNVWLGVSVEDQKTADERIPHLLETPAAVRWVSYEPALGPVDFSLWMGCLHAGFEGRDHEADHSECAPTVTWIVVGGESGRGARPFDLAWARSTVEQCKAAGVAAFFKQAGSRPILSRLPNWDEDGWGNCNLRLTAADGVFRIAFDDRKGGDPSEWPADLRVREYPA